jgi:hypothetical protein
LDVSGSTNQYIQSSPKESAVRFLVMVKVTEEPEAAGQLPTAAMMAFNETLIRDGVLLAAEGLKATSKGARITYAGGSPTVTDGPFAESKELVAGFWILQGRSKEEIVERLLQCPFEGGEFVEIRQIADDEEIGARIARKHERG